jgi:DNA-binding CsgD family transcriptional regulator
MLDFDKVPWRDVHEVLLDIESAPSRMEFVSRTLTGMTRLIPNDISACLFDEWGKLLFSNGLDESACKSFNEHYRFCIPILPDIRRFQEVASLGSSLGYEINVWNEYPDSEFTADFARPLGNEYTLTSYIKGMPLVLSIQRSFHGTNFSDGEGTTLSVLYSHINNLYSSFEKLERSPQLAIREEEILELFPQISRREAQVAALLCLRLTTAEIASKLFLSVRTVEWYLEQLYLKLGVRNRREAISKLNHGNECRADEL